MNDHCKSTELKLLLLIVILNKSDAVISHEALFYLNELMYWMEKVGSIVLIILDFPIYWHGKKHVRTIIIQIKLVMC